MLLEHVVSEIHKTPLAKPRPDFSSQIPPANISDLESLAYQAAALTKTVMHFFNHCDACVKCGRTCCRFAKPSGLSECTGMRLVALMVEYAEHPDPCTRHFEVRRPEERPQHNYAVDPIEPIDSRPLVFEMKRPASHANNSNGNANFDIVDCLDEPQFAGVDQPIKDKLCSLTGAREIELRNCSSVPTAWCLNLTTSSCQLQTATWPYFPWEQQQVPRLSLCILANTYAKIQLKSHIFSVFCMTLLATWTGIRPQLRIPKLRTGPPATMSRGS